MTTRAPGKPSEAPLSPEPAPSARTDSATSSRQPPPLFDITDDGTLTPPLFEDRALTPYGRHHGLGPGIFPAPYCGDAHYGSVESSGRRVWIWHACTRTGTHDGHKCDRCEATW